MTWRRLLPVSVIVAVVLAGVGVWVGGRSGCSENFRFTSTPGGAICTGLAPHPFRGSFRGQLRNEAGAENIDYTGDQRYWYLVAGVVVALALAAIPAMSRREASRG